jgi:predicted PurR-regulated permease PerM
MAQFQASNNYPFWLRGTVALFGLTLFFTILSYGRFLLLPLAISALLALLLEPLCQMLEKLKIGRIGAILVSMLIVLIIVAAIIWFLANQLIQFADQLPQAGYKLQVISNNLVAFFHQHFNITPDQQIDFIKRHLQDIIERSGQFITTILGATRSVFTILGLLPFLLFFMLYYRNMYSQFLHMVWKRDGENQASVEKVIENIQFITRNYILGLLTVITILSVLNGLGLWLIGMNHVLFFAVFSAIMAIIPYIGVIIGSLPAILYAIIFSSSPWMPVGVIAVMGFNQFLEGNIITPNVVGSRVRINPFIALVALIIGGGIWGIAGMILFVPYVGILKCILDEIEPLKPYGYLLGNRIEYTNNVSDTVEPNIKEDSVRNKKVESQSHN